MMRDHVEVETNVTVNGSAHRFSVPSDETLLETLRNRLGLLGTKAGCGIGYCGACTVIVNGLVGHACCLLTGTLPGAAIETVEAVAGDPVMTVLSRAFVAEGAIQCGYCTPGFIVSSTALLREEPQASEARVREHLLGNICRCTGFAKIVRAVLRASRELQQNE